MIEQGAELGINPLMKQVLDFAGLGVALVALVIENIHHQPFGQPVPPYRHAGLWPPFLAQIDPLSLDFDIGQPVEFGKGFVVRTDPEGGQMGGIIPLFFGGNP